MPRSTASMRRSPSPSLAGDTRAIGQAMNAQATVHGQLGDLDQAEALNLEARTRALAAGDTRLAALTALDLGVIAQFAAITRRRCATSGRVSPNSARSARRRTFSRRSTASANCSRSSSAGTTAARAFEEAAQIADAIGDRQMRITLEVNRAELEILRGDLVAARAGVRSRDVAVSANA